LFGGGDTCLDEGYSNIKKEIVHLLICCPYGHSFPSDLVIVNTVHGKSKTKSHIVFTFPEHLSLFTGFGGIRIAQSLVFFVVFCRSCVLLSFGHCVVCSSLIWGRGIHVWMKDIQISRRK
jgi:hypothetical protein